MTAEEKIKRLTQRFSVLEDWTDRYALLIDLGKSLPLLPDAEKDENLLIKGCQSRVWIKAELKDGLVYFKADSDAVITKGLAALLLEVFSGQSPQTILDTPLDFLEQIGLREHLSPTRSNGLNDMIKQIKLYALAFSLKK